LAFGGVVVGLRQTIGWFWMVYSGSRRRGLRGVNERPTLPFGLRLTLTCAMLG
ncbi:MAG: hypothetical protein RL186_505, partial [Pseudomonadota bacterium]